MVMAPAFGRRDADASTWVVALLAVLLIGAPLVKGGNAPLPLLFLELGSLALLLRLAARPSHLAGLSRWVLVAVLVGLLLPLLYLVPLPMDWWAGLPGRGYYAEVIRFAHGAEAEPGYRQVSLIPFKTEWGWYALFFPVAVFLTATALSQQHLMRLLKIVVGIAVAQALLALVQFSQGPDSALRFGNDYYPESGIGTYVSRNHLVGLLYMALPLTLALLGNCLRSLARGDEQGRRGLWSRLTQLGSARAVGALLYSLAAVVILLGIVFTRSRAGIGAGMLGLLLAATLFALRFRGSGVVRLVLTIAGVSLLLAVVIGVAPVLSRFASPDTVGNGRLDIFSASINGASSFLPIGAGPSTFPQVFPRFQPADMVGFINRAHNDYIELLFDGGVLLLIPAAVLVVLFLFRVGTVLAGGAGSSNESTRALQVASGIGVLLMLLHSIVDFNLHIPANMGYFAFLAGVFFNPQGASPLRRASPGPGPGFSSSSSSGPARERRPAAKPRGKGSSRKTTARPAPVARKRQIPEENLVNPFAIDSGEGEGQGGGASPGLPPDSSQKPGQKPGPNDTWK